MAFNKKFLNAACNSDTVTMKDMVEKEGVNVSLCDDYALYISVIYNFKANVSYCLSKGANPNCRNGGCVYECIKFNYVKMIEMLILWEVEITPEMMEYCIQKDRVGIMEVILLNRPGLLTRDLFEKVIKWYGSRKMKVLLMNSWNYDSLALAPFWEEAVRVQDTTTLTLLMYQGFYAGYNDHMAIEHFTREGNYDMVQVLLTLGNEMDYLWFPLALLINEGKKDELKVLLDNNIEHLPLMWDYPMLIAVNEGYSDIVEMLLDYNFIVSEESIKLAEDTGQWILSHDMMERYYA